MGLHVTDKPQSNGAGDLLDIPIVAFGADNHYAMPLAAAISSVIANSANNRKLRIFVVAANMTEANRDRLRQLGDYGRVSIEWLQLTKTHSDVVSSLPCGYVGRSAYYKLFLPELLGPEYSRIIYLDSDVIVEKDIGNLWRSDIGNYYVLAVQDLINPFVSSPFGLRNWRQLGREPGDALFNTGVLVLNAARWHEENITQKLIQYLKDHHRYVQLCDQDAMNAVFRGEWGRLNARWNVLPYMSIAGSYSLLGRKDHEELLEHAHVYHYCGPSKPWNKRCNHPRKDRFFRYLDMTAWSGWRPQWWTVERNAFAYYARRIRVMCRRIVHPKDEP